MKPRAGKLEPEKAKAAARALDVFEAFADAKKPMNLTELSQRIETPISSCHALVQTLRNRGYLYALNSRRVYPTRRLSEVADEIASHDPILESVSPSLKALRDATRETIVLGKRQGDRVVYLDVFTGLEFIRFTAEVGETRPLGVSAIGKAILSDLSPEDLDVALGQMPFAAITERTITSRDELLRDLEAGRSRGYFVTRGEYALDVMSLATSCRIGGELVGFAIVGPLSRLEAREERFVEELMKTKAAILEPSNAD